MFFRAPPVTESAHRRLSYGRLPDVSNAGLTHRTNCTDFFCPAVKDTKSLSDMTPVPFTGLKYTLVVSAGIAVVSQYTGVYKASIIYRPAFSAVPAKSLAVKQRASG